MGSIVQDVLPSLGPGAEVGPSPHKAVENLASTVGNQAFSALGGHVSQLGNRALSEVGGIPGAGMLQGGGVHPMIASAMAATKEPDDPLGMVASMFGRGFGR